MFDTTRYFIIWGIITLVSIILAICVYFWISRVSRFENRKKEIMLGLVASVLAISSFMFLPILFSRINLQDVAKNIFESLPLSENGEVRELLIPFINGFSNVLLKTPLKYITMIVIGGSIIATFVVVFFIFKILFLIREPEKKLDNKYTRKKLFEYNKEIVTELNKKK